VGGSLESETVAVDEAPAHDGVEGMMERIDGRGSDACPNLVAVSPRSCRPFSYWLTFSAYVSYHLPILCILACFSEYLTARLGSRPVVSRRDARCVRSIITTQNAGSLDDCSFPRPLTG
jgi:hypothetical protein